AHLLGIYQHCTRQPTLRHLQYSHSFHPVSVIMEGHVLAWDTFTKVKPAAPLTAPNP
ncbi:hypothetical protein P7K49_031328, partial [Saguinus oedipus]